MSDVKLGQIIEGPAVRDAIHVAVAPMVAAYVLTPGEHVGVLKDGTAGESANPIGIVDPFLKKRVMAGETFWLCLYQFTVTGMRHHWSHPAFSDSAAAPEATQAEVSPSEAWIRDYAKSLDIPYEELIDGAKDYVENGNYFGIGDNSGVDTSESFWSHFAALTGKVGSGNFFTCSC